MRSRLRSSATAAGPTGPPVHPGDTSSAARGPGKVVEEDAVPHSRRVARPGHLKGHEPPIVADHRIRRLVARILIKVGKTLPAPLPVEREVPELPAGQSASAAASPNTAGGVGPAGRTHPGPPSIPNLSVEQLHDGSPVRQATRDARVVADRMPRTSSRRLTTRLRMAGQPHSLHPARGVAALECRSPRSELTADFARKVIRLTWSILAISIQSFVDRIVSCCHASPSGTDHRGTGPPRHMIFDHVDSKICAFELA